MIFFRRSLALVLHGQPLPDGADASLSRDMSWLTVMCGQSGCRLDLHTATLAFCGGPTGSPVWERAKQRKQRAKIERMALALRP